MLSAPASAIAKTPYRNSDNAKETDAAYDAARAANEDAHATWRAAYDARLEVYKQALTRDPYDKVLREGYYKDIAQLNATLDEAFARNTRVRDEKLAELDAKRAAAIADGSYVWNASVSYEPRMPLDFSSASEGGEDDRPAASAFVKVAAAAGKKKKKANNNNNNNVGGGGVRADDEKARVRAAAAKAKAEAGHVDRNMRAAARWLAKS